MVKRNPGRGARGQARGSAGRGAGRNGARGSGHGAAASRGRRGEAQRGASARGDAAPRPRTFRLGTVAGATPGKWVQRWREQRPEQAIELVPLTAAEQRTALDAGEVDAAIVRLPLAGDADDVHILRLYDEVPVVVASNESSLMAADELAPDDLAGEVLITAADDVLGELGLPTAAPRFDAPATTEDAIAIAASGIGVVVVPMSLARLHHRRDADYRPLAGAPVSQVALAWRRDRDADDVQHFAGITRGRGVRSSR
ncbi:LysR substrate-binding domain-containing protein [Microbacterium halophytorum]|uniref:LysR substrate-binding domain-containing protein n=1 Tax=Microbacterium halophytorum TaxID=2067568 RepID=UPI0018E0BD05|nr:LysR substrate-binding domain-containing protein [Microbacterium halophytorum]